MCEPAAAELYTAVAPDSLTFGPLPAPAAGLRKISIFKADGCSRARMQLWLPGMPAVPGDGTPENPGTPALPPAPFIRCPFGISEYQGPAGKGAPAGGQSSGGGHGFPSSGGAFASGGPGGDGSGDGSSKENKNKKSCPLELSDPHLLKYWRSVDDHIKNFLVDHFYELFPPEKDDEIFQASMIRQMVRRQYTPLVKEGRGQYPAQLRTKAFVAGKPEQLTVIETLSGTPLTADDVCSGCICSPVVEVADLYILPTGALTPTLVVTDLVVVSAGGRQRVRQVGLPPPMTQRSDD